MSREVTIMTPEQVEVKFELAGIGSRFIALLIDTLWQALIILALVALGFTFLSIDLGSASIWIMALLVMVFFVITTGYFLYFEAKNNGQTPGKKYAGIRVVRDTGHPIDFRSAMLRNVMRIVDSLPASYGVGIVSIFFSPQYRRLGDYVGGTLVVKVGRTSEAVLARPTPVIDALTNPSSVQPESTLPPEAMPYISNVNRDDYRAIRHFLDRRLELEETVTIDLAAKLAGPIVVKLQMDPAQIGDPLVFLQSVSSEWERRVIR